MPIRTREPQQISDQEEFEEENMSEKVRGEVSLYSFGKG
jgi:hypothetical protein